MALASPSAAGAHRPAMGSLRQFGPFNLTRSLGHSSLSMAWLAQDRRNQRDVLLMLPRLAQVADSGAQQTWLDGVQRAARLDHPRLEPALEIGQCAGWVYVCCQRQPGTLTLAEQLIEQGQDAPLTEAVGWCIDALEGLAGLHDSGFAHGDVGLHSLLVDRHGRVRSWGLALTSLHDAAGDAPQRRRAASEQDVQSVSLLLHRFIARAAAFGEPDLPRARARLGREALHLPSFLPEAPPPALRAIADRATDPLPQRRYVHARGLQRALEGWRQSVTSGQVGALVTLAERLRKVGHLPALPGLAPRVVQLARMEIQPLSELVEVILDDPALSLELLRQVNSAAYGQRDEGPVTTVRRAIQLVGVHGVRRAAASLRAWPGPLKPAHALALDQGLKRARLGGCLAQELAPGGLDLDGVRLIAQLQHLGRLLALYHFPEESVQIVSLMQPTAARQAGERGTPGLCQDAAAMAVLGVDLPSLARAVVRAWGMGARVEVLSTALAPDQIVRAPDDADGWMRLVASCANESLDVAGLTGPAAERAQTLIVDRYGHALGLSAAGLRGACERAKLRAQRLPSRPASAGGGSPPSG